MVHQQQRHETSLPAEPKPAGPPRSALWLALALLPFWVASPSRAGDWAQYRGPTLDGFSPEGIRTNWSVQPPRALWKIKLEAGLSSLTVSGGRVFTQVRRKIAGLRMEVCVALDQQTGKELWATAVDSGEYPDTAIPDGEDGPRSTPVVAGDRVFIYTSHLRLICLNAATGVSVWQKDFRKQLAPEIAFYGGASPVLEGGLVLVNSNVPGQYLTAFRPEDGSIAWTCPLAAALMHATPVPVTLAGVRQVIAVGPAGLFAVAPQDGKVLWRWRLGGAIEVLTMSPVVGSNVVYYSSSYGEGATAFRIENLEGALKTNGLWRTRAKNQNYWATPVHHQGHIYGTFGYYDLTGTTNGYTGQFGCVELQTGKSKWQEQSIVNGAVLTVGRYLVALTDFGQVALIEPDPAAYREIGRFQAVTGRTWNSPAFSDGRLYVRSMWEAACYDLAPAPLPALRLSSELAGTEGLVRLRIGYTDGSPVDLDRQGRVQILATTNLGGGPTAWAPLASPLVLTNGELRVEDPLSPGQSGRFYRTREEP